MDTMKYLVECKADNQKFNVRFATYDEAMTFFHAFHASADFQNAVVKEWVPHRGYFIAQLCRERNVPVTDLQPSEPLAPSDLLGVPREEGV